MSDASKESIKRIKAFLEGIDVPYRFALRRNGHQAVIINPDGAESRFVIIPGSGSDSYRGPLNDLADVRRAVRALGLLPDTAPKVKPRGRRAGAPCAGQRYRRRTKANRVRSEYEPKALPSSMSFGEALAAALATSADNETYRPADAGEMETAHV